MGIEIVLYSSSPIIQKIFFHVLYHYNPKVHRIDQPSILMEKIKYHKPDIIFIDDLLAQESSLQTHIKEKTEDLKSIPIILMARKELDKKQLEFSVARDFLKKPISADKLRELVNRFVPKVKSNILTQYLTFAPIPDFEGEREMGSIVSKEGSLQQNVPETSASQLRDKPKGKETLVSPGTINPMAVNELQKESISPPPIEAPDSKEESSFKGIDPITATQYTGTTGVGSASIHSPLFVSDKASNQDEGEGQGKEEDVSDKASNQDEGEGQGKEEDVSDKASNMDTPNFTEVKILKRDLAASRPLIDSEIDASDQKKTEESFNTQLKNQIDDYIQKWAGEKIKSEVEEQLKHFVEEKSQEMIQKIAEKAVWQVVPELARQLITKELERLLKEEDTEEK